VRYAVEVGTGAMMYIPSFVKISSGIEKLIAGIHRHKPTLIYFYFFFSEFRKLASKFICLFVAV
jgi:hypothetical protein